MWSTLMSRITWILSVKKHKRYHGSWLLNIIKHISDARISLIPAESELAKKQSFLADAFCDIIGARENFFLFCSLQSLWFILGQQLLGLSDGLQECNKHIASNLKWPKMSNWYSTVLVLMDRTGDVDVIQMLLFFMVINNNEIGCYS